MKRLVALVDLIGMCEDVASCGEPFAFEEIVRAFEEGGDNLDVTTDDVRSSLRVLVALGRIERVQPSRREDLWVVVSQGETTSGSVK